jgi:putative peptidoglycan lipid II flippase
MRPTVSDSTLPERALTHPLRAATGVVVLSALGLALGYARDAGLAAVFGASATTDAFFIATIIPTMAATVVVSGALAPALLPVFTAALHERTRAWALANALVTMATVALAILCGGLFLGAPLIVRRLAPGFDPHTTTLAVQLTMMGVPLLGLLGLSALLAALANSLASFRVPALSTTVVNGGAFLSIVLFSATAGIHGAVIGLVAGALLQLVLQTVSLRRAGWHYAPSFAWQQPAVIQVLRLFAPLSAFVALAQVVPIVERVVSSQLPAGDLSLLAYAAKLFQIPGVVLSSSLAIVLYPQFAQRHVAGEADRLLAALVRGVRTSVFLTLPSALWFFWNAEPLVRLIFQRGQFSPAQAQATAHLVQFYMLALVPSGALLLLTSALHAQRKMVLTLLLGIVNTTVYIIGAFSFASVFGLAGLPLAFVVSQVFGCALFGMAVFGLRALNGLRDSALFKLVAAGIVVAGALAGWSLFSGVSLTDAPALTRSLTLIASLVFTAVVYLALLAWWGNEDARIYLALARARARRFGFK